jgi:hypothetical protein
VKAYFLKKRRLALFLWQNFAGNAGVNKLATLDDA